MARLIAARRTAVVPRGGAFARLSVEELAAPVIRACLADAGLSLPDEYIKYFPISRKGIREKLQELFELPNPPTAIFAPADDLAIRVIHGAHVLLSTTCVGQI